MSPGSKNRFFEEEPRRLFARKPYLRIRAEVILAIRRFFAEKGYLEVETPLLIPAPPPEVHIDAIKAGNLYLQTSPELYMKRLLAAGYDRIFQVSKCFRQGERGHLHLPEFTLLEWYRTGIDYKALMEECEALISSLCRFLGRGARVNYQGREVDFQPPWERMTVKGAFHKYASLSMEGALDNSSFDEVMVKEIEPHLGVPKPTFLYDYPASLAALARLGCDQPELAERFELYVGGVEIANAFSELTDALEQRQRFESEMSKRRALGKETYPISERFLRSLEHLRNCAGIALGVDRLVMIFADRPSIDDVVSFVPEEL